MLNTYEQHSKRKLIATILSIAVIAGVVVFADHLENNQASKNTSSQNSTTTDTTPSVASTTTSGTNTTNPPASTASTSDYKDGSYTASSDYYVPHGSETISVNLTLKSGVIADVSVQNSEGDRESAVYQEDFASVYKSYVVGKKITDLQLGIVAGASDTTQAFDDALSQIASKAQA